MASGWELESGDFLVANAHGVAVVREGEVVAQPVLSPVESALAEFSGAIVFITPDPGLYPSQWPALGEGGGYVVWRVQPDGELTHLLRTDFTIDGPLGAITFFQAPEMPRRAEGFTTPIFKVSLPGFEDRLLTATAGNFSSATFGIGLGAEITGAGWQESENRLIVSLVGEQGPWLAALDHDDDSGVGWPSDWPNNPLPLGVCAPDGGSGECVGTVTSLPGTTLIAYTITDPEETRTELVIYDTRGGTELRRLLVAEAPMHVKMLHASGDTVVVSLIVVGDAGNAYAAAMTLDWVTGDVGFLPVGGVATIAARPPD